MLERKIVYTLDGYYEDLIVKVKLTDKVKIPDEVINKVLAVVMNYLIENMEILEYESVE